MKIKISGSSGYLGSLIMEELKAAGHNAEGIKRELLYGPVDRLAAELQGADAVVHLAGAPILKRWTRKNKKEILESRSVTGKHLAQAIKSLPSQSRPSKVVSSSGVSIYAQGRFHTENSPDYDRGFLSEVVRTWENAWEELPPNVDLTIFRMGVVLGKASPPIRNMLLPFKTGLGGKIGNGRQPFPFIHEKDVARAYLWALENKLTGGIYILAAPHQISNKTFTKALSKSVNRPAFLTVPPAALKLVYGEASTMLTHSPSVHPEKLLKKGFKFTYPTIEKALEAIFK